MSNLIPTTKMKVKLYESSNIKQVLSFCSSKNGFAKGDTTSNSGFKIGVKHTSIVLNKQSNRKQSPKKFCGILGHRVINTEKTNNNSNMKRNKEDLKAKEIYNGSLGYKVLVTDINLKKLDMEANETNAKSKLIPKKQLGVETDPITHSKIVDDNFAYEKTNSKSRYELLKLFNGATSNNRHKHIKSLDLANTGCENDVSTIKLKEKFNKESEGWEFRVGKKLGYKLAEQSNDEIKESIHIKLSNYKPSDYYRKMNDKALLRNDREDFLNNSINRSTYSTKSVDNHTERTAFLDYFSEQKKTPTRDRKKFDKRCSIDEVISYKNAPDYKPQHVTDKVNRIVNVEHIDLTKPLPIDKTKTAESKRPIDKLKHNYKVHQTSNKISNIIFG